VREIKFRAWDNKNMWQNPIIHHGKAWCYNNEETELVPWYSKEQTILYGEPILMQYTGFKDKNGKEIYEGDILKTETTSVKVPNITVYWFEQGGRWNGKYHGLSIDCEINDSVFYTSEVIGNIYENPGLI
jgi:uncharacterized phage protein (TIGR01671 family)